MKKSTFTFVAATLLATMSLPGHAATGSVSGTGYTADYYFYDAAKPLAEPTGGSTKSLGKVDSSIPITSTFSWDLNGDSGRSFSVTGASPTGSSLRFPLPEVTFQAASGYVITGISFGVQGTGLGFVYSNDGFDDYPQTFNSSTPGGFNWQVSGFIPGNVLPGDTYEFTGGDFSLYAPEGLTASATKATFTVTVSPVPEPETYAMMLAGLGALGFIARRRRG